MKSILSIFLILVVLSSCTSEEEKHQQATMRKFTDLGDRIAGASFASLSGNLKAATIRGGIDEAIKYCNENASSLTDSLSQGFKVKLKRTSTKLRNEKNKSDSLEAYFLDLYSQIEKMKKPMVSKTILTRNNEVRYFAPIFLKAQCLTCHGNVGREITEETYSIIKKHYPNDQAIGFQEGELRGIWSINFGKMDKIERLRKK